MRRYLALLAAAFIAIALCGCPFPSLTSTQVSDANKTASQTNTNAVVSANGGFKLTSPINSPIPSRTTLAAATKQVLTLSFSYPVDSSSMGAIHIYTLKNTADTDGAYTRNTDIAAGVTPAILSNGTGSNLQYTLDLSETSISNLLEIYIDGSALTGAGGTLKLNTDGDATPGEALDDDVICYVNVSGAPVTVAAAGNERNPQAGVIAGGGGFAVGATELTVNMMDANFTAALINACVGLQKFNATSKGWDNVSFTGTFSAPTYTMTLATAMKASEIYRLILNNPYNLQETKSVNGYQHRASYDQKLNLEVVDANEPVGPSPAATETLATVLSSYTQFDDNGYHGSVTIIFNSSLSAAGIDSTTVTADNIKIWDMTAEKFVPWTTSSVYATSAANDTIQLVLDPAYQQKWDKHTSPTGVITYTPHNYYILTFPGLLDGTLTFGDWTNNAYPYFARFFKNGGPGYPYI
jgi:hypothetical protein